MNLRAQTVKATMRVVVVLAGDRIHHAAALKTQ
jgi:hypothetical protein